MFHPGIHPPNSRKIPAAHRGAVTAVESAGPLEAGHRMDGWMEADPWTLEDPSYKYTGKSTMTEDVFPIQDGDFPASYVCLPEGRVK